MHRLRIDLPRCTAAVAISGGHRQGVRQGSVSDAMYDSGEGRGPDWSDCAARQRWEAGQHLLATLTDDTGRLHQVASHGGPAVPASVRGMRLSLPACLPDCFHCLPRVACFPAVNPAARVLALLLHPTSSPPPCRPALRHLHARPGAAARLPLPPGTAAAGLPARHDLLRHLQPGLQAAAGNCGAHTAGGAAAGSSRRRRARRPRQARRRAAGWWRARQGHRAGPRQQVWRRSCGGAWGCGQRRNSWRQGKRRRTS